LYFQAIRGGADTCADQHNKAEARRINNCVLCITLHKPCSGSQGSLQQPTAVQQQHQHPQQSTLFNSWCGDLLKTQKYRAAREGAGLLGTMHEDAQSRLGDDYSSLSWHSVSAMMTTYAAQISAP
jgi:hypothetical protein